MDNWGYGLYECREKIVNPLIAKGKKKGLEIALTVDCAEIVEFIESCAPQKTNGLLLIAQDDKNQSYHLHINYKYDPESNNWPETKYITQDAGGFMTIENLLYKY